MSQYSLLIAALMLGIGGSLHCIGMCGPLVLSIDYGDRRSETFKILLYHTSRVLVYMIMGAMVGMLTKGLHLVVIQQYLSIVAGVILIVMFFSGKINLHLNSGGFTNRFSKWFGYFWKSTSVFKYMGLGALNALLPCGLVYTAIGMAFVSVNELMDGVWFMFFFGLGTMPLLVILSLLKKNFTYDFKLKLKKVGRVLTLLVGVLLILRGLNLGIPYVSPQFDDHQNIENNCHKPM